jgi:tellurite resistance protein TerC
LETIGTSWMWTGFAAIVLIMLAIDLLLVGGGKEHKVSLKEAGIWSAIWVSVALLFAGALWWYLDATAGRELADAKALEFVTGYLIEKALAVDNVFVWLMLFSYFAVPPALQKRVLIYGVLGAIVLRTGMIFAGAWLIAQFHWVLYLFGAFLLITGIKMYWFADREPDLEQNPVLRWLRGHLRVTTEYHAERFFIQREEAGRWVRYATPLLLALVLVEVSDLIFAVDSIPAIFAITTDPFIVLTSNVFAILGLRAMYFLLADVAQRFTLLKYGLAMVLMFIGVKMLLIDLVKIPIGLSLGVVAAIIAASVILSLRRTRAVPTAVQ